MKSLRAKFKLWFSSRDIEGAFGDGRWRLLKKIESTGSLREASTALGISYRKAWGDLRKTEQCLGVQLAEKQRGGSEGGQTVLNEQGKKWVKAYEMFHRDIEKAVEISYRKHIKGLT